MVIKMNTILNKVSNWNELNKETQELLSNASRIAVDYQEILVYDENNKVVASFEAFISKDEIEIENAWTENGELTAETKEVESSEVNDIKKGDSLKITKFTKYVDWHNETDVVTVTKIIRRNGNTRLYVKGILDIGYTVKAEEFINSKNGKIEKIG